MSRRDTATARQSETLLDKRSVENKLTRPQVIGVYAFVWQPPGGRRARIDGWKKIQLYALVLLVLLVLAVLAVLLVLAALAVLLVLLHALVLLVLLLVLAVLLY